MPTSLLSVPLPSLHICRAHHLLDLWQEIEDDEEPGEVSGMLRALRLRMEHLGVDWGAILEGREPESGPESEPCCERSRVLARRGGLLLPLWLHLSWDPMDLKLNWGRLTEATAARLLVGALKDYCEDWCIPWEAALEEADRPACRCGQARSGPPAGGGRAG